MICDSMAALLRCLQGDGWLILMRLSETYAWVSNSRSHYVMNLVDERGFGRGIPNSEDWGRLEAVWFRTCIPWML
jgi:hypothetical protein